MQGVAEVYPVSSSAQLSLLPWLLRWEPVANRTGFAAGLHLGSTAGLAFALRREMQELPASRAASLVLATAPAAAVGFFAHDAIERRLGKPGPTSALMAGAGMLLLVADRSHRARTAAGADLAVAGVVQVLALAPGVSRTGITLTALRSRGVARDEALQLSLLMSLPVAAGAATLTAVRAREAPPLVPSALAAVAAYTAYRRLRPSRAWVASSVLYRLVIAAAVAARLRKEH